VARAGDLLLGSSITELDLVSAGTAGRVRSGLSMNGPTRVAYRFVLADGREGIAVWSLVPEPGSAVLVCLAMLGLGGVRVRRRSVLYECGR